MIEIRISRFGLVLLLLMLIWLLIGGKPGAQAKPEPRTVRPPSPNGNGAQPRTWDTSGTAQEAAERGDAVIYGMVAPALKNLQKWNLN